MFKIFFKKFITFENGFMNFQKMFMIFKKFVILISLNFDFNEMFSFFLKKSYFKKLTKKNQKKRKNKERNPHGPWPSRNPMRAA
jgi:hypothetical protein